MAKHNQPNPTMILSTLKTETDRNVTEAGLDRLTQRNLSLSKATTGRLSNGLLYKLTILLLIAFAWFISPQISLAQETHPSKVVVIRSHLNVRMGPRADTPLLTQLNQGDVVDVISQTQHKGWWLIKLPDGQRGWISSNPAYTQAQQSDSATQIQSPTSITVTPKIEQPSLQQIYIAGPQVNVHVGPSAGHSTIAQLKQGQIVPAIKQNPVTGWWLIRLPDERVGWICNVPHLTKAFQRDEYIPLPVTPSGTIIFQPHSGGSIYAIEAAALNGDTPPQPRYIDTGIDPALSPDGTQLAYTTYAGASAYGTVPSEIGTLWVYNLQTGQKRALMGDIQHEPKAPTWSPDGKEIIINYQHGGRLTPERRCLGLDDNARIPEEAFNIHYPKEGGVCYKLDPDTHWKLRKINVETGQYEELAAEKYSFAPTWDPANPWRVVFFTPFNGLLQYDLNRGVYFPFKEMPTHMFRPTFSPDGSKVAVTFWLHDHWEIFTVDAANGALTRLTTGEPYREEHLSSSAAPAWSPDGKQIIFLTNRNGTWEPWLMDADGSNPRRFLPPEITDGLEFAYNGVHEQLFSWR